MRFENKCPSPELIGQENAEEKDLPIGKTQVKTRAGLPMSTNWPIMTCAGTSYNSILLIVGLNDQPVQIPIDEPCL